MYQQLAIIFALLNLCAAAPSKELGRACKLKDGEKGCGENAQCSQVSIGSLKTGLGMCDCKSNGFRQPGLLPPAARTLLRQRLGEAFWRDCVPILKLGDTCIPTTRRPPSGDYYYADAPPDTNALMPDNAQCGNNGVVQCKPGRVRKSDTECVPIAQANRPAQSSLTPTTGGGAPCRRDNDCAIPAGTNGAAYMVRMRCRAPTSSDYNDGNGGNVCICPVTESNAIIAPFVLTNTWMARPKNGIGGNDVISIPARVNATETPDPERAPVSYWCLNQGAFKFTPNGYLGACNLDLLNVQTKEFRYCTEGLVCMYFPVTEEDNSTMGRCVPVNQNDPRWSGSTGGAPIPPQNYPSNQPSQPQAQPQAQAQADTTPQAIKAGAADRHVDHRIFVFFAILPLFVL